MLQVEFHMEVGDFSKAHRDHIGPRAGSQLEQSNHHQIVIPNWGNPQVTHPPILITNQQAFQTSLN